MPTLPIEIFDPKGISSPYGMRTLSGKKEMHYGIDFPCSKGTPVLAYDDGVVVVSKLQNGGGGLGEYVTIKHGDIYSIYAHLSVRIVVNGTRVKAGDIIGHSGNTGRSTGPHLHFGLCRNYIFGDVSKSKWFDPLPYLKIIISEGVTPMRALTSKSKGADVAYLQYLLNKTSVNPRLIVDGSFGPKTRDAVLLFQKLAFPNDRLQWDGIVGPKTREKLGLAEYHIHIFYKDNIFFAGMPFDEHKRIMALPKKERPDVCFTAREWAEKENADQVWNLAMFNMSDGATINYLKAQGFDVGYSGVTDRVSIDWKNVVGGYKVGIKAGKRVGGSTLGKRSRNAVGKLADGRFFIVQSLYNVTEYNLVSWMLANYNVDILIFEDGGGSTFFYDKQWDALISPEKTTAEGRPVPSVLCYRR